MSFRILLITTLLFVSAQPLLAAKKNKKITQLSKLLPGSTWQWHTPRIRGGRVTFQPNGLVRHEGWDERGLVTSWKIIDHRTVLLYIEKGRDTNRIAVITFNEKATEFAGWDFARGRKLSPCRKLSSAEE